ncbi:ATP-binding protein [Enterovirga sp. GCM10030262]|uniref:sensor histidine kinase n=1 Tax=Enterovirga sp. GCM10030262 TaxID=3273391 RepID=UPI00360B618D
MSAQLRPDTLLVHGRVDLEGRLVEAEPALASLHERAGGREGGMLAIPQIASLARLSRRLGIVISRAVIAADGPSDLDLWVRAEPSETGVALAIGGWTERPARRPAEASEAERESDFLRASADWMWETDEALRFTALSPAAAAAVGKLPAELIGKQLTRLFRFQEGEDGALPILTALAEQRRFDDQFAELRSGSKGRYRLGGVPLIDGAGRFAGFRGAAASLPRWLPEAAANDAAPPPPPLKDSPAFGERLDKALRVPLDHIIANAETIGAQPDGPLRRDYAGYAHDIATAGRHLLALVDDLVDLQAIERPEFAPEAEAIDLADVARRAAGLLAVRAADRGVRIDRPGDDETLPATGEFRRVLQILMNLITNAIRYSPEGAQVWIRTEREDDLACVIVADQGKGIAPEDQARIFDKFERIDPTEAGGTGLGLYIARRLARVMGGDIAVDSAPGQGARFTLTLPLS